MLTESLVRSGNTNWYLLHKIMLLDYYSYWLFREFHVNFFLFQIFDKNINKNCGIILVPVSSKNKYMSKNNSLQSNKQYLIVL